MEETITKLHTQFSYVPEVVNIDQLGVYKHYVVAGMGGSHLAAGILKMWKPGIEVYVHKSYDLPPFDESFLEESLCIASSYSGNTEEVLSFAEEALERGLPLAVIATGGALLALAQKHHLPYIQLPNDGVQPRCALGYSLIALATLTNEPGCVSDMHRLGETFRAVTYRTHGETLAEELGSKIPVIYSSLDTMPVAYNWKIKCNETGKIPAFYNIFPELNHNEMQGYDAVQAPVHFIVLRDANDHPRIQKRMEVLSDMLRERGYGVSVVVLEGPTVLEKVFASLATADWMALAIAERGGQEPAAVPMIEAFKKRLN
jgi:glucose/mannose-6-phosphate isomerase